MEKRYEYIVVGGGPAGIMSSIYANRRGIKTCILEKKEKIGKKMLIAGSGQCNITHTGDKKEFLTKYGENSKFLRNALYKFGPEDLKRFFEDEGLKLVAREDGKIFPKTMRSLDVVNLLLDICRGEGVDIYTDTMVENISSEEKGFKVETNSFTFRSENILISTGGITFPQTGSDGDGYRLGKKLGHKVQPVKPSLTPIHVKDYPFSSLSGISFKQIEVSVISEGRLVSKNKGDILFTHKNISGPGILDNSRYMKRGDRVLFNFLGISFEEFKDDFLEYGMAFGKNQVKTYMKKFDLPERFLKKVLELSNVDPEKKVSELKKEGRDLMGRYLTGYPFEISKLGGIEVAMCTNGGISIEEINPKTMESKLVKGLYFSGEVVDIDGNTGGYNIQGAISMGVLAGNSIKLKKDLK